MSLIVAPTKTSIAAFKEWIRTHTIRAVSGKSFVLKEQLCLWLHSEISGSEMARTVLDSLLETVVATTSGDEIDLPSNLNSVLVFCILLQLDLGHLLPALMKLGISDQSLPISKQDLHSLSEVLQINKSVLTVDFFGVQWKLCPAVFELDGRHEWSSEMIVPIYSQNLIDEGRTAKVYEVYIPEDFIGPNLRSTFSASRHRHPDISGSWCYRFALKTFDKWNLDLGKTETNMFRDLTNVEGFIRPLVAFAIEKTPQVEYPPNKHESRQAYSILFECGESDLINYFASKTPPITPRGIELFWRNLCGVARAVQQLHSVSTDLDIKSPLKKQLIGYHHDIKPSNIILSGGQFKLSDFGFAAILDIEQDPIPPSAVYGTVSYGPPEPNIYTTNPTPESLQKFDLWSLGCVLSEAATWAVLGQHGIENFRLLRRQHLNRLYDESKKSDSSSKPEAGVERIRRGDYFHDGKDVLTAVSSWHDFLRSTSRNSDAFTVRLLDIVDQALLVSDISERVDAKTLVGKLDIFLQDVGQESQFILRVDQEVRDFVEEIEAEEIKGGKVK